MDIVAVQDRYAPKGICFGCGSSNSKGLQIKSQWEGDEFIMRFTPSEEHQAFPGIINGGILGTLLDCHSNWCAATALYYENPDEEFPSTVTADFHVKLTRPTPFGVELVVRANIVEIIGKKVIVEAKVFANDKITATCQATFIAVKEGHIAHNAWNKQ
ncbi:MAG: PaaI family thioesterase [Candidatus Heimdallarchaeota archaeon]|nr:PaaI family thioesterase [Candidatus Heimdallarchaeota archaeon]